MKLQSPFVPLLPLLSAATLNIPAPEGPRGTNFKTLAFTDPSRLDPFAPHPEDRSVVISVFYPVASVSECNTTLVPAYPPRTAAIFDAEFAFAGVPNGTLEAVRLSVCNPSTSASTKAIVQRLSTTPTILFSPGLGTSRLLYSALAQAVASAGFIVITLDHPYDADVVEFPDGRLVLGINSTWPAEQIELANQVRTEDALFVLDEITRPGFLGQVIPAAGNSSLPTARVGIFGHSLGGATAASALLASDRFVGGINLDGGLVGPVVQEGLDEPFILFGHKSNTTSSTWCEIWPRLKGWKLDLDLVNSTHGTFTDLPILAGLAFGEPLPPAVEEIVGTLPGTRARDAVAASVGAFFGMVLKCEIPAMLQRASAAYPEVEFLAEPSCNEP